MFPEEEGGGYRRVTVRLIVAGFTPLGKLQAVDYSCTYDVESYFLNDLMKRIVQFLWRIVTLD